MSDILLLEKVTSLLCLGHIAVNVATAVERMKFAAAAGVKWEATVNFTTIAAFILSVCALARWAVA